MEVSRSFIVQSSVFIILLSLIFKYFSTNISSWKEIKDFPPIISPLAYQLLMSIIFLISISLSFNPPTTKIHFFILYTLAFLQILIPMLYNSKYHCTLQAASSVFNFAIACKLLLWLKKYHSPDTQESEFNSFFSTLFIWRPDPLKIDKSEKKYIDQITINDYFVNQGKRFAITTFKFLVFEFILAWAETYKPIIPDRIYLFRVIDYFLTGKPFITPFYLFYNYVLAVNIYIFISLAYDIFVLSFGLLLPLLQIIQSSQYSVNKISKSRYQAILSSKIQEVKEWLILLLFHTKVPMNFPFISTSPRDFWSKRWHIVLREIFLDLGYVPVKNLFGKHKKIGNIFGILSAFFVSGLLHEYIVYCMWGNSPGEQMLFFLFHGLLLILWEVAEGLLVGNGIAINEVKDSWGIWLFKLILFNTIAIFGIPSFFEPYLREDSFVCMIQVGLFHNKIGLS
ncbi:411_t:CDS:1 [Dentiscutata heterogama]|uniref:411_t:CDS:1 n=1 Tax=Dentiscutata heterogama TaxID=1316150 RepID=A0ACA9MCB9_9GLOM|nr:411_t:CDS:1 [Dentiscutata heterogama]